MILLETGDLRYSENHSRSRAVRIAQVFTASLWLLSQPAMVRVMTDSTSDGTSDGSATTAGRPRAWVTAAIGALALAGVILGVVALTRPTAGGPTAASFSHQPPADAKAATCKAFDLVRRGVSRNTHLTVPGGPSDVTGTLAVAANARISLYDGGQYLLARIDPATPKELADAARGFADTLMDIGAAATAGAMDTDPDQVARLHSVDEANIALGKLCA